MDVPYLGRIPWWDESHTHSVIVAVGSRCIGRAITANHIHVSEVLDEFLGTGWGLGAQLVETHNDVINQEGQTMLFGREHLELLVYPVTTDYAKFLNLSPRRLGKMIKARLHVDESIQNVGDRSDHG